MSLNSGAIAAVGADAVQVVAFLGDASGDGYITSADAVDLWNVAGGSDAGFAAYRLADPNIIGDLSGDGKADGATYSLLTKYINSTVTPQMPAWPGVPSNFAAGPDPAVSIQSALQVGADGSVTVPVHIDDPQPAGSRGMTEAMLALTYDAAVFSVSSSDIQLGTVPASGSGWKLQSVVDQATGQIGVTIWSPTPIGSSAAGSLVTIDFHLRSGLVAAGTTTIDLVSSVDPNGIA